MKKLHNEMSVMKIPVTKNTVIIFMMVLFALSLLVACISTLTLIFCHTPKATAIGLITGICSVLVLAITSMVLAAIKKKII